MAVKKPLQSMADIFNQTVQELEESITKPNILSYVPYEEQERFLKSTAFGRYISGGNRGGKTDSIVVDAILTATDTNPYRPRPLSWGPGPVNLRFVVVDIDQGVNEFIIPKLRRWVAKSMLIEGQFDKSWHSGSLTFTFDNGSTIDFLTHNMALEKHGGVPRHAVYFDEIPPQSVFNENAMRLVDYEGFWAMAATSTEGMGWTYDYLWEPAIEGKLSTDELEIFTMTQEQNPYLAGTSQSRNRYYIAMDEQEEKIRRHGEMTSRTGLIFPDFKVDTHVIPSMLPPRNWAWYTSTDFGINNPTVWLWHAVSPEGDIVTFAEHYKSDMSVPQHALAVHMKEAAFNRIPDIRVGDPAGKQRQMNTGTSAIYEYANLGLFINVETIPREVSIGIEKMRQYFEVRPVSSGWGNNRPRWVITEDCPNFIKELRKLHWATYESSSRAYNMNKMEEVHKKDDHAFDSARYFATLMPDLTPVEVEREHRPTKTVTYVEMMYRLRQDDSVEFVDNEEESLSIWDFQNGWDNV